MCVRQQIFEVGPFLVKILKLQTTQIPSALFRDSYFAAVVRQGPQKCVEGFKNTQNQWSATELLAAAVSLAGKQAARNRPFQLHSRQKKGTRCCPYFMQYEKKSLKVNATGLSHCV